MSLVSCHFSPLSTQAVSRPAPFGHCSKNYYFAVQSLKNEDTKATCRPCCLGAKLYVNTYKTIFHFTFFFSIICKFVFETAQSKLVLEFIIIK